MLAGLEKCSLVIERTIYFELVAVFNTGEPDNFQPESFVLRTAE